MSRTILCMVIGGIVAVAVAAAFCGQFVDDELAAGCIGYCAGSLGSLAGLVWAVQRGQALLEG